ncbi:MAG: DUF5915 domain-containing protein, partial [Candidatus Hodarchaeota archaeon]
LEDFPKCSTWHNGELNEAMEKVRLLASLGRNVRAEKGLKLRHPLAKAYVRGLDFAALTKKLMDILSKELNVKEVFLVREEELPGSNLAYVEEQGLTVGLDTTVTPALHAEGIVRDAVRVVQQLRKSSGLALDDQINVTVRAKDSKVLAALEMHREYFMQETQAQTLTCYRSFAEDAPFFKLGMEKSDSQWFVQKTP